MTASLAALLLVLSASPTLETARRHMAVSEFDSAIPLLEAYRADRPESEEGKEILLFALHARARRAYASGDLAGALRDLARAAQVEPSNPVFTRDLAVVHAASGVRLRDSGDTDGAIEALEKALRLDPSNPAIRATAADLHVRSGEGHEAAERPLQALSMYRRALEIDSNHVGALLLAGQLYYRREEFELARQYLRRAREITSNRVQGLDELLLRIDREQQATRPYQGLEMDNFLVRFEGGERPEIFYQALPVLQEARERAGRLLERTSRRPVTVIIYSGDGYQRSTDAPDWSAGLYDGKIRLRAGEVGRSPAYLARIVRHEMAHALIEEIAPGRVPAWVQEGVARYLEIERWDSLQDTAYLLQAIRTRRTPRLSAMKNTFATLPAGSDVRLAYALSGAAARFLATTFGEHSLAEIVSLVAAGRTPEEAVDSVTFCDMELFQRRVEDWVVWEYSR